MTNKTTVAQPYRQALPKPVDEDEFEEMCLQIYGSVYSDLNPQRNGRKGQAQGGVDIFIVPEKATNTRIGIQCKRYVNGTLTKAKVVAEIREADQSETPINSMLFATTADSDARLIKEIQQISDNRQENGKFPIKIDFWGEICAHIFNDVMLTNKYAPSSPGAIFSRVEAKANSTEQQILEFKELLAKQSESVHIPAGREDSANRIITGQIDGVTTILNAGRYRDAMHQLEILGKEFPSFDSHQQARWHLQRGVCRLHCLDEAGAAEDFLTAWERFPSDEKIQAARIRGLTLLSRFPEAIDAGKEGMNRFPASAFIWAAMGFAKIAAGQFIAEPDVPADMANKLDVIQLLCWNALQQGDFRSAGQFGTKLLTLPDVGPTGRTVALAAAISLANADPVAAMYGLIKDEERSTLIEAIKAFDPLAEKLWTNQSEASLPDDIANLAYGYRLLGENQIALKILDDAPPAIGRLPRLLAIRVSILRAIGRDDQVVTLGNAHHADFDLCAILPVADAAASAGDVDLLEKLISRKGEMANADEVDLLYGFRWIALVRAGRKTAAVDDARKSTTQEGIGIALLLMAARVFLECDQNNDRDDRLNRAASSELIKQRSDLRLMLADLMVMSGRNSEAAYHYAFLVQDGMFTLLHKKLLLAYLRSRQLKKAKALLDTFPPTWINDDDARNMAINLANLAGDWKALLPLANFELERSIKNAGAWLLRLAVEEQLSNPRKAIGLLNKVPEELIGTTDQIGKIASAEIMRGKVDKGMRRLYRLLRENFGEPRAASVYLATMLCNKDVWPYLQVAEQCVGANTSIRLVDEHGAAIIITIDPDDVGVLPKGPEFLPVTHDVAGVLIGKKVGDVVDLPGGFGTVRRYRVVSISSAYGRLLDITREQAASPTGGMTNVAAVQVIKQDGTADLTQLGAILNSKREYSKLVFDQYAALPLTVGACAMALGISTADLLLGWPNDAPQMKLSPGSLEHRIFCQKLLATPISVAIDLPTLAFLVALNAEHILACFEKVFIGTLSREVLLKILEKSRADSSTGHVAAIDNKFQFSALTAEAKNNRVELYERVEAAIERYCEVRPAYGGTDQPEEFIRLRQFLGIEEYEGMLLAQENGVPLFTFDQITRVIAKGAIDVDGLDVQTVLAEAFRRKLIVERVFLNAAASLFVGNFTYVSIDHNSLLWMLWQTGDLRNQAIKRFREVISDPASDFGCSVNVIFELIELTFLLGWDQDVIAELVSELCEPLFRIPNCPFDQIVYLKYEVSELISRLESQNRGLELFHTDDNARQFTAALLMTPIRLAKARVDSGAAYRSFPLSVIYCTRVPTLHPTKI